MMLIRSPRQMQGESESFRKAGKRIGFVPTMGYLHQGHLSLIRSSRKENDIVVLSIFVNPTQFGPKEDYKQYPRDLARDKRLVEPCGVDIIFCPSVRQIYPEGYATTVHIKGLTELMCGLSRPGHFDGVCTICAKLFNIVKPDAAYFGQKDYQQAVIIRKMVEDLDMGFKISILPIIRERNGLAMSSRNKYLSPSQRDNAGVLYASLKKARALVRAGHSKVSEIKKTMRSMISDKPGIRIDYISIADPYTLREKNKIDSKTLIAIAAFVGKTRLIDNIIV